MYKRQAKWFIEQLASGKDVAVITDAGTPCFSDPGNELIRAVEKMIRSGELLDIVKEYIPDFE